MLRSFVIVAFLLLTPFGRTAVGQDQLVQYFSGATAGVGNLGAQTFDANGDFWVISLDRFSGPAPVPRLSKVEFDGSSWSAIPHALDEDMRFFYRSSDAPAGITNPLWGGPAYGTPNSFLLNPAPLTVAVETPSGQQNITYAAGELAFITDAMGALADQNANAQYQHTKKVWRYDLRKVDNPNPFGTPINGSTSQQPDFATASNGDGTDPSDFTFGAVGLTDWNDAFTQVVSEQDLRDAAGGVAGSDNFGRSFAWSSDGQSIYAVDAGSRTGGIYKIDATQVGAVQRIRADVNSNTELGTSRIITEPAVVSTSVRDFDPSDAGVGDQIIVMGSGDGGNQGGLNAYLDTGAPGELADPAVVFDAGTFRRFADYYAGSAPQYTSVTADPEGNLYFSESRTDGVFRYDTEGRLVKIMSEREHNLFQTAAGVNVNDTVLDLQYRTSTGPGFEVGELVFTDDALDAPLGIYAYKPGDFDRDNDLDADDLGLFAAAIGLRNTIADDTNAVFDLNGNEPAFRSTDNDGNPIIRHESGDEVVVDWRDVKILQQFAEFPDGDTNFDMTLDFTDLDAMEANYYTTGQTAATWVLGDFASIDPDYIFDAADANLVNEVDLAVLADAWLNDLGLAAPTEGELMSRYTGQFLADAIAAFDATGVLAGDYDRDGDVDADDYNVWSASYGATGTGLGADGNGDGVVNAADYTIWRDNSEASIGLVPGDYDGDGDVDADDYNTWSMSYGATGTGLGADGNGDGIVNAADYTIWRDSLAASGAQAVPEPATLLGVAVASLLWTLICRPARRS